MDIINGNGAQYYSVYNTDKYKFLPHVVGYFIVFSFSLSGKLLSLHTKMRS